jgi:serine/threonine-protein kinase
MSLPLHERLIAAIGHHYELEGEIGRGGMAVVYRARDLRLDRRVAIKVLPPELTHDPAVRTRFAREAHTSAQLSHPNIVPIYDVGEGEGIAWLVMALVDGGSLSSLLARAPRPPIDDVRKLLAEVCDALAYAHARGVIHRDIKPDNILLGHDSGRAWVTDFGIARAVEANARLTQTGIAVGTPTYMSPEQAIGERAVDGRSDIYSLGVVAYQMLTGRVPFTAGNSMALLLKHVTERARPIGDLRPETPGSLCAAIERALMKSPEDRWPTADALREAILSEDTPGAVWRAEPRDMGRVTSPRPDAVRRDRSARESPRWSARAVSPRRGTPALPPVAAPAAHPPGTIVLEPEHLASLTADQRRDLRIWHGRVNLLDRIKAARGYFWLTAAAAVGGFMGFVLGMVEADEAFPFIISPIVPMYMARKLWWRCQSLRASGLKLRRVFLMPRAKWVFPAPPPPPTAAQLEKLAPREVLESPLGRAIRRAEEDRAAILAILAKLPKADRALLPDLEPTVDALVERVSHLAQMIHELEPSADRRLIEELDARITDAEREQATPDDTRRLALLRRQRATLDGFVQRRAALERQLESAGLALGNLRLDLIKVQSSGLQSALTDVSTATQEARALSREIGVVLDAAAEVRSL